MIRFTSGLLLGALLLVGGSSARAQSDAVLQIPVVTSLTGQGAFVGKSEAQAFGLIEGLVNRAGGIDHRPVRFNVIDDTSSPQTAIQIVNDLAAKKTQVFLGQTLTVLCNATAPIVRDKGPVQYCLSPGLRATAGGFSFSSGASLEESAAVAVRYYRERGLTRMAILMGTDATGQEMDRDFDLARARPENINIEYVAHEHFNLSDISIAAQLARIKAARPQVLLTWNIGPSFGTLLHAVQDSGLNVPVLATGGDMIYSQLEQYDAFMPKELVLVGSLPFARDRLAKGPIHDALTTYLRAFASIGVRPDFTQVLAWDPAMIVLDAYRHLGTGASAEQIRSYVTNLHGFAGINGIYDFRDGSQRGIGDNAIVLSRWDASSHEFVQVSKRAGHVL